MELQPKLNLVQSNPIQSSVGQGRYDCPVGLDRNKFDASKHTENMCTDNIPFTAWTLLVGQHEGHLAACKIFAPKPLSHDI